MNNVAKLLRTDFVLGTLAPCCAKIDKPHTTSSQGSGQLGPVGTNILFKMNLRIIAISISVALCSLAYGEEASKPKSLQMDVAEVHNFSVSLMELREASQLKRFDKDELKVIAKALASARFLKKMNHEDVARTPHISRYQFRHGFRGGTPRTGESESGMLTLDCRTLYWEEWIFELDEANATKLRKLFPSPKNPLTTSESPALLPEEEPAQPDDANKPAAALK